MEKIDSASIIKAAGGDKAFARLLGIDRERGSAQRVNNWKRRGIPSGVVLEHLESIRRLQKAAASSKSGTRPGAGR